MSRRYILQGWRQCFIASATDDTVWHAASLNNNACSITKRWQSRFASRGPPAVRHVKTRLEAMLQLLVNLCGIEDVDELNPDSRILCPHIT